MEIKAEIQNNIKDVHDAYNLHLGQVKAKNVVSYIIVIGSIIFLCIEIVQGCPFNVYSPLLFLLLFGCYRIWWLSTLGNRAANKNPSLLDKYTVIFTDDELRIFNDNEDSTIKWKSFANAKVSTEVILMYQNKTMFYFYPKRFFSEVDFAFIKDKANQTIAQNESKKSPPPYRDSKP